jgi:hypothetical protein
MKTGGGQHNRIERAFVKFTQTRVDISADGLDHKIAPCPEKLCLPSKAARADDGSIWKLAERPDRLARNKRIAHIVAFANRVDAQTVWKLSRKIFQTMNG